MTYLTFLPGSGRPQTRSLWKGLGKLVLGTTSPAAAPAAAENEPVYIALKAPNGMLLAANADATVSARVDPGGDEPTDVPLEVVFRVEKHSDIGVAFWVSGVKGVGRCTDSV